MNYEAENMVEGSRFRILFRELHPKAKEYALNELAKLVEDNSELCTESNYGDLCNIFSCIAIFHALEFRKLPHEDIVPIMRATMFSFLVPVVERMKTESESPEFIENMRNTMPAQFSGPGWEVDFPEDEKSFKVYTYRCLFYDLLTKYKLPEMAAAFCEVDNFMFKGLPGLDFSYTEQLGCGGSLCDYSFSYLPPKQKSE